MPTIDEVRPRRRVTDAAMGLDRLPPETLQIDSAGAASTLAIDAWPVPGTARPELNLALQRAMKRVFDVSVAFVVLLFSLPLIAAVSLAIVAESPGPVFYRADRVGRGGRRLRMLKFRKMHHNASGAPLTMSSDARFTRIGGLLARTKIDELPQLWHVLCGDMSLIGPRPEDPRFVAERPGDYEQILSVRPGITGLSQLAFAEESEILDRVDPMTHYRARIFPQKIRLDRLYAAGPTLRMDVAILFWTVAAVLLRRQVAVHRESGRMNLRRR
jgi:lipopolysaccharide/colanic/teichoic acid biosynthesis glycosyltransferase